MNLGTCDRPQKLRSIGCCITITCSLLAGCKTGPVVSLRDPPPYLVSAAFTSDGKLIAGGAGDGSVSVWNASTGDRLWHTSGFTFRRGDQEPRGVAISRDAQHVAFASEGGAIHLSGLESGARVMALSGHPSPPNQIAFLPDGNELISSSGGIESDHAHGITLRQPVTLIRWDLKTQRPLWRIDNDDSGICNVAFSPEGRFIACNVIVNGGRRLGDRAADGPLYAMVQLRDATSGKVLWQERTASYGAWRMTFSANGERLFAAGQLWDTQTGNSLRTVQFLPGFFSPDGRTLILFQRWRGGTFMPVADTNCMKTIRLDVASGDTNESGSVTMESSRGTGSEAIAISPDARAYVDAQAQLWHIP
jgi:WD40 repeat protein